MTSSENEYPSNYHRIKHAIASDRCPDCGASGLVPGPRGGLSQNCHCAACGSRWNVTRVIVFIQRLGEGKTEGLGP